MIFLAALFSGLVFGFGLILSEMSDPAKVIAFLDLAGNWDPSLLLVMAGAIGVAVVPFGFVRRVRHSLLGEPISLPEGGLVDRRLVLGSLLFGIGWGLAGICPGPALVSLGAGYLPGAIFAVSMFLGMKACECLTK